MREPGLERLAEYRQAFRQLNAVKAKLHLVMVAADVDLAERILRDPGRLQQCLIEGDCCRPAAAFRSPSG